MVLGSLSGPLSVVSDTAKQTVATVSKGSITAAGAKRLRPGQKRPLTQRARFTARLRLSIGHSHSGTTVGLRRHNRPSRRSKCARWLGLWSDIDLSGGGVPCHLREAKEHRHEYKRFECRDID